MNQANNLPMQFSKLSVATTVLMVAEKPSLAASLANILSDGRNTSRKGSNGTCQVHEWKGFFRGMQVNFRMTSVCGHVLCIDFTSKYNNWDKVDPLELFSCPVERKEASPRLRILSFLAHEARGCDFLVLWLDCDKEGENICFEVIDAVKSSFRRPIEQPDVVWRAHFSSITPKDVKAAMNNLGKPNINEALSVDARQELDLRIGCAFTRYQTKYFQGKYGNLDSSLISFGPCQTPTLGFCVERHDRIQTFRPEPYWVLQTTVITADQTEMMLSHHEGAIFEKERARNLLQKILKFKVLKVTDLSVKEKTKARPIALNTVELMKHASSGLGLGPHYAMTIAERLYTQGYISYPRTETTNYPANFDLMEVLLLFVNSTEFGSHVDRILTEGINRPRKGVDVGDHPPITPMKSATYEELGENWKLYDYIVKHFIATVSHDCKYMRTKTTFAEDNEVFTCTGDTVIDPGYTLVMPWQALNKDRIFHTFQVGDEVTIKKVEIADFKTTPPDYLTESELITLMEKHGIGTDASIPVHINNISQRNYVTVGTGRRLIPTNLGIVLVHGYQKIDKELVEPTIRSKLEIQLNLIARGEADYKIVLADAVKAFRTKFVYFTKNIDSMDNLFEVSFTPLSETGKAFSRCGKCRRYMKYIMAKPNRLHCSHCNDTYNLPQNGNIRTYKEIKCPLDDFELLTWTAGSKSRSYPICPHCYNAPPYEGMKKYSGCNQCLNEDCAQSFINTGISQCLECNSGDLVLDPSSAPKWKVVCNNSSCDMIFDVFHDAHKVTVMKEVNCECGSQLIKVEYREERTKLPGDRTEMCSCMFCDEEWASLVRQHRAINSQPAFGRGRGRGRGGRGCGGGRGRGGGRRKKPKQPKDRMAQLAAYFV